MSVRTGSRRGSIAVAAVLFLFFVLLIGALSVDMARFFYVQEQNQNVADGATLAAANAYDQVRTLDDLDEGEVVEAGFRYLRQQKGYDDDVYELSASLKKGDVITDRFGGRDDPVGADTVIRVGLNVKHSFEPYFLPRQVFGDEYFTVQSQAVAEMRPVYSSSNLYDPHEPGPPKGPLQYGVFSDQSIKLETMDCFVLNGDLKTNDAGITIENMQGSPSCGSDPSDPNVEITGDIESGGDLRLLNFDGSLKGEARYDNSGTKQHKNAPTPTEGIRQTDVATEALPDLPTPGEDPSQYPGPICEFTVDELTVTKPSQLTSGTEDCSDGGTIYVKEDSTGTMSGDLTIDANMFNLNGDYNFVADGRIKFQNQGDLTAEDMFVYSVDEHILFENAKDATINATLYAPKSFVKWETSDNVTINGGVIAQDTKLETTNRLTINQRDHTDLLPGGARRIVRPNDVPDYWKVRLIE